MLQTNFPRLAGRPVDYRAITRRGYLDQRILVVSLDDPRLDSFDRQYLQNLGDKKLYGRAK